MTGVLLRENPAIRSLPRWFAITLVTAGLFVNVVAFTMAKGQRTADANVFMAIVWLTLVLYLVFGEIRTRCSNFDMSLPISARRLWLSHLTAVTLSGLAILVVALGVCAGLLGVMWKVSGNWHGPDGGLLTQGIQLAAGWILAVALLQHPGDLLQSEPRSRSYLVRTIIISAAILALVTVLSSLPVVTAILPLTAAAIIGGLRYRRIGACFTFTSRDIGEGAAADHAGQGGGDAWAVDTMSVPSRGLSFSWFLVGVIYRSFLVGTKKKISPWVTFPFVAVFGSLLSGLYGRWMEDDLQFVVVPMVAYALLAFSGPLTNKLSILDAVPISRRLIFAVLTVPLLLLVSAGYGGGRIVAQILGRQDTTVKEPIEYFWDEDDGHYYTRVPIRFCRIAWDGEVPLNEAPWGEKQLAWHTPLFRGASIEVYSPFSTPPGSSIEFVAWQISRATEAVYGEKIPAAEIGSRYLRRGERGTIVPAEGGINFHRDYPHLEVGGDGPLFPVLMAAVAVLWLLLLAVFLRTFRAGVTRRRRMITFWTLMAFALSLWIGEFVLAMAEIAKPWVVAGFVTHLVRSLGDSIFGIATVYVVCSFLIVLAYGVAARMFRRAEFPVDNAMNACT